jgi:hypothetical protein
LRFAGVKRVAAIAFSTRPSDRSVWPYKGEGRVRKIQGPGPRGRGGASKFYYAIEPDYGPWLD